MRDALVAWPRATAIVFVVSCASGALSAREAYALSDVGTLLAGVGWLIGLIAYKALFVFMLYPVLFRAPFPGSFFGVAFVVTVLLSAILGVLALLGTLSTPLPPRTLIPFLVISFVVSWLMLGVFLRINYWMHRDRWVPWRRLDALRPAGV